MGSEELLISINYVAQQIFNSSYDVPMLMERGIRMLSTLFEFFESSVL